MSGTLITEVFLGDRAAPVEGAVVETYLWSTGETIEQITGSAGKTSPILAETPDANLSLDPSYTGPAYSLANVTIRAQGYQPLVVEGVQLFDGIESILPASLTPALGRSSLPLAIRIPENALHSSAARHPQGGSVGLERILRQVYIPENITVHLGRPDSAARNVTLPFPAYIKNVASSEIYPTWPESSLRANILAQIGFALNRVYTEWYPSRGYDFNITNTTAYDQYFVEGRNIFENISRIVDEIFTTYPRRLGQTGPLFTSFCNGTTSVCGGLSQWGTVSLAEDGLTPLQILQYYYGSDVELATAPVQGLEGSYPGTPLRNGSRGEDVALIQSQLHRISRSYPLIPTVAVDGIFGDGTEEAVRVFQQIFDLTPDGIVGPATWYKISYIYVAVTKLAELDSEGQYPNIEQPYPGRLLSYGSRGNDVQRMQQYLQVISRSYSRIPSLVPDGIFGDNTLAAVEAFQRLFGLTEDGIVGPDTWNKILEVWRQTS